MQQPSIPDPGRRPRTAHLPTGSRIADYSFMALAIALGGGSIVLFAWPGEPVFVPLGLSTGAALWWNTLLSGLFFAQHSVMVRRSVRARLAAVVPPRFDLAFYAIASGLALTAVALLRQPAGAPLIVLTGGYRAAVWVAALLAVAGFAWGVYALRSFDPLGLRPIREHLWRAAPAGPARPVEGFVVRGPYLWVRHPLYSCVIVLLWADPEIDAGRLLFASLWTAWIYLGALLEERDLVHDFGEAYREYRRQVPILIPWRGRVSLRDRAVVTAAS